MPTEDRIPIGLWSELPPGSRWTNEGVSRVVGFLVEGAAQGQKFIFHVAVPRGMAETVREDLSDLDAVEGVDWQVWEPSSEEEERIRRDLNSGDVDHIRELAEFANRHIPVEAWVITFPHFGGSLFLDKPKATLYPDALPYDFPLGWNDEGFWGEQGWWPRWRDRASQVTADSHAVITFSRHVAERHAGPLCGVPIDKVRVVPLAPPDLATLLSSLFRRRRSSESRAEAADILRRYAEEKELDYLRDFPFEEVDFIAAATQDRPTKNLGLTASAVRSIVRDRRRSMKMFTTATVHWNADWTRLPAIVRDGQFQHDLLSMPDLPRKVHAALFHASTAVVHSSYFEGIVGTLPFYEACSVGTPALIANGPHIEELLEIEPDVRPFVYDPYDCDGLADLILDVSENRADYVEAQSSIYQRLSKHSWKDVATRYAEAALEGAEGR